MTCFCAKSCPCAKTCHMTHRSLGLVHSFLHSSPFYPTPKFYALQCFSIVQTPKSAHSYGGVYISLDPPYFSYHQRLAKLKLESLELRRLRADLLFTYRLVFSIIDLKLSHFLSQISVEQAAATNTNYACPLATAA